MLKIVQQKIEKLAIQIIIYVLRLRQINNIKYEKGLDYDYMEYIIILFYKKFHP